MSVDAAIRETGENIHNHNQQRYANYADLLAKSRFLIPKATAPTATNPSHNANPLDQSFEGIEGIEGIEGKNRQTQPSMSVDVVESQSESPASLSKSVAYQSDDLYRLRIIFDVSSSLKPFFSDRNMKCICQATKRLLLLGQMSSALRLTWSDLRVLRRNWGVAGKSKSMSKSMFKGLSVCLFLYASRVVASCFMWSGALDRQLWCSSIIFYDFTGIAYNHPPY